MAVPFNYENSSGRASNREPQPASSEGTESSETVNQAPKVEQAHSAATTQVELQVVYNSGAFFAHMDPIQSQSAAAGRLTTNAISDQPLSFVERAQQSDSSNPVSAFTFVQPAKWTVISTGVILWSVRFCQLAAALASTAKVWSHFDPVLVIQSSQLTLLDEDEAEADGFTEKLFDNQTKRVSPDKA